jgi:hypothetical protein
MDSMEASCVIYVKVGKLDHFEHNQIWLVTVNTAGIVWLTIQHDMIVRVSFMYYPRQILTETSPDFLFLEGGPVYILSLCNFALRTPQFIPFHKRIPSNRLIVSPGTLGNPCNLQPYATAINLSITYDLAATYVILTSSYLYIPQDLPLHFVIIFLSYSTPASDGYTNISARSDRIRIEPYNGHFR